MQKFVATLLVVLLGGLSACATTPAPSSTPSSSSGAATQAVAPSSTTGGDAGAANASPSTDATPASSAATLASGTVVPTCVPQAPRASATVTFAASGHAWALNPDGTGLTCLFGIEDVGPFEWGPLGDRVLLGGLEVKYLAGGSHLAASGTTFAAITWSRPTGKSIVYAPVGAKTLEKVFVDGSPGQHVTPLESTKYLSITYHPSGEAYAFAVERDGGQSIWMSTNTGTTPVRLVFSTEGTTFGAIGFEADGKHLLYAAQHADNHAELHRISVTDTTKAPVMFEGPVGPMILDIRPGLTTGTFAWTSGTSSCTDSVAMAHTPAGTAPALLDAGRPTRAVGWLSETSLLVAAGGCHEPLDLFAVDASAGTIVSLVSGVFAAAVRTPVPTPPAALPAAVATLGSGFS
jgi:hypothetical protein